MISLIRGSVYSIEEKGLVIDTGNIGYFVYIPDQTKDKISLGEKVEFFTHMVVREDSHDLFGFEKKEEKDLFIMLITVSGVGPKIGLHIISSFPVGKIISIIKSGSGKELSMVPGIGKKTSEKIVIDLKEKMKNFVVEEEHEVNHDVFDALVSLGYKEYKVHEVLSQIDKNLSTQNQIKEAIKLIGK